MVSNEMWCIAQPTDEPQPLTTNELPLNHMVLILDGNSEIGANVKNNIFFVLFKAFDRIEGSQKSKVLFLRKDLFPLCVRNMY